LHFFKIGSRREIKTRGNDVQRLNALEQLKRARQGGQVAIVEQVKEFVFFVCYISIRIYLNLSHQKRMNQKKKIMKMIMKVMRKIMKI
jgi:hypothetical protein